jgi:nucleoside phosphorylase
MGQIITRGPSLCLGKKDVPVHVTRNGYARKLKWISKKFVLLWDEDVLRGWLINGTSTLLHLVRTALYRDKAGDLSSLIAFDPAKLEYARPYQPGSAAWVLSNKANLTQRIYAGDDELPTNFQNYATGFYDVLEKMIDHQMHTSNANESSDVYTCRSQLEGWDFDDLASERDPIYPRASQLDPTGRSWADLVKSIHAITLFGGNFGDIIRSTERKCAKWSTLPTGRSYLAVSRGDLMEIMTACRGDPSSAPVRLTDSVIWHIPEGSSTTCKCNSGELNGHSNVVQVLLPASMAHKMVEKGSSLAGNDTEGAVIFGYNSEQPLYWPDCGEPLLSPRLVDHCQEKSMASPSHDSGIGQSVSSSVVPDDDSAVCVAKEEHIPQVQSDPFLEAIPASQIQQIPKQAYTYLATQDYTVAVICALHKELKAVRMLFDETHDSPEVPHRDPNHYVFGGMAKHNVVATCLPDGEYGTNTAADVAANMKRSFPRLRFCLLVGIGGGVPGKHDIRLGDVVVSTPGGASVGVLPYDTIKTLEDGTFQINGYLHPSPRCLRSALSEIQSDPRIGNEPLATYLQQIADSDCQYNHPGEHNDTLFSPDYAHLETPRTETCEGCDSAKVQIRPPRGSSQPQIHYGLVASGNQVMRSATTRDKLGAQYGIMCFEMEAAGIMNILSCLVIRGICDYCDSHKNKHWQKYAAATAAAFAKLLLSRVRSDAEGSQLGSLPTCTSLGSHDRSYGKRGSLIEKEDLHERPGKRRRANE